MQGIRRRISPGVVLGAIALIVALSGTSIALPGTNSVDSGDIKRNAVRTSDIRNGAVSTGKLRNNAVTSPKIADNAVGPGEIADNAVNSSEIANGSVLPADLAAGTVRNVTFEGTASPGNSSDKILSVDCGAGRRAIGGFYEAFDFGGDVELTVHIMRHQTISGEARRGVQWFITESEDTDNPNIWQVAVTAVCADI
jgi:hypothetical protein